jgi:hypothetical protein
VCLQSINALAKDFLSLAFDRFWQRLDSLSGKRQTLKVVTLGTKVHGRLVQGGRLRRSILLLLTVTVGSVVAQRPDYQGPTILSRGMGTVLQGGGELLELRPYLSLDGIYDSALTSVSVDQQGKVPQTDGYGAEVGFGVYGYHNWRHSMLGVDYRGNLHHYNQATYYDGTDHMLSLGFTHQPTRRLSFTLREAAGMYSRSYGWFNGYQYFDPAFANVPTNELFDGRTIYMSTMGDITYTMSPRLSFNVGGSGMVVRRRSQSLVGTTGWTARGDVAYRASRTFAVGADYNFSHYEFTGSFGASDIHTVSVDLSARLGRGWDLGLRAGGARVEILGLRSVAVDPVIAAIIGRTTGVEVLYETQYLPSIEATLARVFRRSSLSFGYGAGVDPGNGMYLTSRSNRGSMSYSYTASRRWNFGLSGGYGSYSGLSQSLGKYESYNAGGGLTCKLMNWVHLVGRYDARRYTIESSTFRRFNHRASVGIAFSPGDLPLSLW